MKYTATCEHCKKETAVGFSEWQALNKVMLSFMDLSKEKQDMILLMIDGALYRAEKKNKPTKNSEAGDE